MKNKQNKVKFFNFMEKEGTVAKKILIFSSEEANFDTREGNKSTQNSTPYRIVLIPRKEFY